MNGLPSAGPIVPRRGRAEALLAVAVKVAAGLSVVSLAVEYGFHPDPARAPITVEVLQAVQLLTVLLYAAQQLHLAWTARDRRGALRLRWIEIAFAITGLALLIGWYDAAHQPVLKAFTVYVIVIQAALIARRGVGAAHSKLATSRQRLRPARLMVVSFLVAILIGGLLLSLPRAMTPEHRQEEGPYLAKRVLNCFFTAVSATCVTGLVVYDTGKDFTLFGQVVILVLIQAGGLGIMVFGTLFGMLAGRQFSLRDSLVLQDAMSHRTLGQVTRMVQFIVIVTFGCEAVGAVLLYPMWPDSIGSAGQRVFHSVFHAISAFCNAGFALDSRSLMPYRGAWEVYGSIMPLIVVGGLGFPVLHDVYEWVRSRWTPAPPHTERQAIGIPRVRPQRRRFRFSLHSRLVLVSTAVLIVLPAVGLFVFESIGWRRPSQLTAIAPTAASTPAMADMPIGERAAAALFQSITTRTAGFNTAPTDLDSLSPASHFLMCLLMFIGGSPASTAGGVKTVALAVMVLAVFNTLRRRQRVETIGRAIPELTVRRAGVVIIVMQGVVFAATLALCISERGHALQELLFESVSACGTVGLSTGLTPNLTIAGRVIIMAAMFAGRLGPLTVLIALAGRTGSAQFDYPEEPLVIG